MTETATIAQLKPGHEYPGASVNSRTAYRESEIEPLAASLQNEGQLYPLLVCTHNGDKGTFYVFDGNRRRLAFERIAKLRPNVPIEIKNFGDVTPTEALRKSWASNETIPLHPADRATVFAKMNAGGDTPEVIAERHGMTLTAVKQSIALGSALAPEIIDAWRKDEIDRKSAEIFTLGEPDAQLEAFAWAKEQWAWRQHQEIKEDELRKRLTRNKEPEMKRLLGLVGTDAYRSAGGEVIEDFFGQGGVVKDMRLLKKMAKQKLDETVAQLLADGWSWAEAKTTTASRMHHGYGETKPKVEYTEAEKKRLNAIETEIETLQAKLDEDEGPEDTRIYDAQEKLEAEKEAIERAAAFRSFTDKQKKKSGVIVSLTSTGAIHYEAGLVRRAEKEGEEKPAARGGHQQREPEPLDWQARHALEKWRDDAARELMAEYPHKAIEMLIASLGGDNWNNPAPINIEDIGQWTPPAIKGKKFDQAYSIIQAKSPTEIFEMLGQMAVACISIGESRQGNGRKDCASYIIDIVGEDKLQAAFAKKFDAKKYFNGASKRHILGVIKEALGEEARKAAEAKQEAVLRKEAIASIPKTGWLPPELRTSLYVEPVTSGDAAPAKKTPAKRKAG